MLAWKFSAHSIRQFSFHFFNLFAQNFYLCFVIHAYFTRRFQLHSFQNHCVLKWTVSFQNVGCEYFICNIVFEIYNRIQCKIHFTLSNVANFVLFFLFSVLCGKNYLNNWSWLFMINFHISLAVVTIDWIFGWAIMNSNFVIWSRFLSRCDQH